MLAQTLFFAIFRYFHLMAAIIGIGGTFMLRYVVLPSLESQDEEVRQRFHGKARRKLGWIIPGALGVLLISGIVNLLRAFTVAPPLPYHIIFGIKFLLVLPLFTIAVMLVLPGNPPNRFQRNRRLWLSFNAHLGFLIVALSVALRFLSGK
jgi:uncharacterized membrane protein